MIRVPSHYCPDCDDFHETGDACPVAQWIAVLGILSGMAVAVTLLWGWLGR